MGFWEGKRVLIAGGGGMCGQSLIRHLVPLGAKVTATEYQNRLIDPEWAPELTKSVKINLMEPGILYRDQEVVFWTAAKVGGAKLIKEDPMGLVHYNLELAGRNIKAAVDASVERFCYISSSYVYPESTIPSREEETKYDDVPLGHYGLGWIKRFIEKLCKAHQLTSQTRFALVRPTAIYGPWDNFDLETCHVIPALIRKVAEKQNPLQVWGDGSEQRQFCYVDDLVKGLLLATEHYAVAEPINIAPQGVSTVNDVWKTLFSIENLVHDSFDNPNPYAATTARPDQLRTINYLGDKPKVISRRLANTEKSRSILGYECKTSLREGLSKTLEWYRSHNNVVHS